MPPSKSQTIRALFCAALAEGTSTIHNPLVSDDTLAALRVLRQLGADISIEGNIWRVRGGNLQASGQELHCGESATTMRFLISVCTCLPGRHVITGGPSLLQRPVSALVRALQQADIKITTMHDNSPPVIIEGDTFRTVEVSLPGDISSQYISGLMLAAPLTENGLILRLTTPPVSKPYLEMTIDMLRRFGVTVDALPQKFVIPHQIYHPAEVAIESDWSSASYFVALGAVSSQGITITSINPESLQADRAVLDIVRQMGASVAVDDNAVTVSRAYLKPIRVNLTNCIDLLPTAGVLSALADGASELNGIAAGRLKESNRVAAVREGLERLGVSVTEETDKLIIRGPLSAGQRVSINSYDDHRIAMAFAVPGAVRGDVIIERGECVSKTFPDFWPALQNTGVEMEILP